MGTFRLLNILLLLLLLVAAVPFTAAADWRLEVGLLVACLQAACEMLVTECNFSPRFFRLDHLAVIM